MKTMDEDLLIMLLRLWAIEPFALYATSETQHKAIQHWIDQGMARNAGRQHFPLTDKGKAYVESVLIFAETQRRELQLLTTPHALDRIQDTDVPPLTYQLEIRIANSLEKLRAVGERWRHLASDATEAIRNMTERDFQNFRQGLEKEAKGLYAGNAWAKQFCMIQFPAVLFDVSVRSVETNKPWGVTFREMLNENAIQVQGGIAVITR